MWRREEAEGAGKPAAKMIRAFHMATLLTRVTIASRLQFSQAATSTWYDEYPQTLHKRLAEMPILHPFPRIRAKLGSPAVYAKRTIRPIINTKLESPYPLWYRSLVEIYNTPRMTWAFLGGLDWKLKFRASVRAATRPRSWRIGAATAAFSCHCSACLACWQAASRASNVDLLGLAFGIDSFFPPLELPRVGRFGGVRSNGSGA